MTDLEAVDQEMAETTTTTLSLPSKSCTVYEGAFEKFSKWCEERNFTNYTENVLVTYFSELVTRRKMQRASLFAQYSMIKSVCKFKHSLDISKYLKLRQFIRMQNEGIRKTSRVFTQQQVQKFFSEAPDNKYLAMKVIMIIAIGGSCRCDELVKLKVDNVQKFGNLLKININESNTQKPRSFTVVGDNLLRLYEKYVALRPPDFKDRRLFIKYINGRCHRTVMGIHKIASVPRDVASYLKLPHPEEYTGHGFKKTSNSLRICEVNDFSSVKHSILSNETENNKVSLTDNNIKQDLVSTSENSFDDQAGPNLETSLQLTDMSPPSIGSDISDLNFNTADSLNSTSDLESKTIDAQIENDTNSITMLNSAREMDGVAEIDEVTKTAAMPIKSTIIYEAVFEKFTKWCQDRKIEHYSEHALLSFFMEMANEKQMKCSTLWARYSMIRSVCNSKHGIDISKYLKLREFLKKQYVGYIPKKTRVFTSEQISQFLYQAPDKKYLAMKIVVIMGIYGACRCEELVKLTVDNIKNFGSLLLVRTVDSRNKKPKSFTIVGDYLLHLYEKYAALRPKFVKDRRLFLRYNNGQCHRIVMGIHKIGSIAKEVATYLKLSNPEEYTGHCFRRTSSIILTNGGTDTICSKVINGISGEKRQDKAKTNMFQCKTSNTDKSQEKLNITNVGMHNVDTITPMKILNGITENNHENINNININKVRIRVRDFHPVVTTLNSTLKTSSSNNNESVASVKIEYDDECANSTELSVDKRDYSIEETSVMGTVDFLNRVPNNKSTTTNILVNDHTYALLSENSENVSDWYTSMVSKPFQDENELQSTKDDVKIEIKEEICSEELEDDVHVYNEISHTEEITSSMGLTPSEDEERMCVNDDAIQTINESFGATCEIDTPGIGVKNQCELFGNYVAAKLNTFDSCLRAIAQNRISQILFELEMDNL